MALFAPLLLIAQPADAATITIRNTADVTAQSATAVSPSTSRSGVLSDRYGAPVFSQFDPTLGTLDSVSLVIDQTAMIEDVGLLAVCGGQPCGAFAGVSATQTVSLNLGSINVSTTSPAFGGTLFCSAGAGQSCSDARNPFTNLLSETFLFTDPGDLANFIGTGTLSGPDLRIEWQSQLVVAGPVAPSTVLGASVDGIGEAFLTYTFTPPPPPPTPVPAPGGLPLMAVGLVGLWLCRGRRQQSR